MYSSEKSSILSTSNQNKDIRVGVISRFPIRDKSAMSGTPASVFKALSSQGFTTIDLSGYLDDDLDMSLSGRIQRRLKKERKKFSERWRSSEADFKKMIQSAEKLSERTQQEIDKHQLDVIVGVCISSMLYRVEVDSPIIYISDTTARSLNSTYSNYRRKSEGYKKACDEIEQTAFSKCSYFLPSSDLAAQSAIDDYAMAPAKVHVVEFGGHVVPNKRPTTVSVPSRQSLEFCLVAADPIRKRLDLCIEITEELAKRGWSTKLNYIGSEVKEVENHPLVRYYGRLNLSDESDRKIHQSVLAKSHWMLLPSLAEAFGIAPAEAAHFARPSAVSSVGGLPTVVKQGITGLVLPPDASAMDYCDEIERVSEQGEAYLAMSRACLTRAQTHLNWEAWAARVGGFIHTAICEGAPH